MDENQEAQNGDVSTSENVSSTGSEHADMMKNEMRETFSRVKGAGLSGILGFDVLYFPIVAKVLWIVAIVILVLLSVGGMVLSFRNGVVAGVITLILTPIACAFYLCFIRMWFEMLMVGFKINEAVQEINAKTK